VTPMLAVYFGLVLARVAAFVAVMPLFSGRTPQTLRAALALTLTIFYFGAVTPAWDPAIARQSADIHWLVYLLLVLREAVIGAALGFAFTLFLLPMRIAGEFVTVQIGLASSQQVGLATTTPAGPITLIFEAAGSLLFLEMNGHHVVLSALHASFDKLPLGGTMFPMPVGPMVNGLGAAYQMGLLLAGPLGLCLFMLAVVLAMMARAAPQLNIYSVGFTMQVLVALVGTFFLLPDMVRLMMLIIGRVSDSVGGYME